VPAASGPAKGLRRKTHQTILQVTDDIETFSFNTALARLMELKNTMQDFRETDVRHSAAWTEAVNSLLLMLAPFTPHIAEELWSRIGGEYSIHTQAWPVGDAEIAAEEIITLAVQVNGKVRDRIEVAADVDELTAREMALASEQVQRYLDGQKPQKVIYVPGRLVNIVQ
jgi:leucyl-tRNA synthetase